MRLLNVSAHCAETFKCEFGPCMIVKGFGFRNTVTEIDNWFIQYAPKTTGNEHRRLLGQIR